MKTTDGGTTWSILDSVIPDDLYSVFFTSADSGHIVGRLGTILLTNDGGTTWSLQVLDTYEDLFSVFFTSRDTGFANKAVSEMINGIEKGKSEINVGGAKILYLVDP